MVVVVDILKPNHSPKTAVNRQVRFKEVRFIRPGVGGLLGAKCKHIADSEGGLYLGPRAGALGGGDILGAIFKKRKRKKGK